MGKDKEKKKESTKEKLVVNFKSGLVDGTETVQLEVNFNKNLQMLLRKVAVTGTREFSFALGRDEEGKDQMTTLERTRVKTAIWNGFDSEGRELLFISDLVMKGKFVFEFYDISILERTMSLFSSNINRAIELIGQCSNVKNKITFVVE